MIRLTEKLWIGGADVGRNVIPLKIGAVLNVAQDLRGKVGWPEVEYMQVGLVDGPGNALAAYHAAVLALAALAARYATVVCCHGGSRSMAVCMMWLNATNRVGWDVTLQILRERCDVDLPYPHAAHREAFNEMNWKLLSTLIGD